METAILFERYLLESIPDKQICATKWLPESISSVCASPYDALLHLYKGFFYSVNKIVFTTLSRKISNMSHNILSHEFEFAYDIWILFMTSLHRISSRVTATHLSNISFRDTASALFTECNITNDMCTLISTNGHMQMNIASSINLFFSSHKFITCNAALESRIEGKKCYQMQQHLDVETLGIDSLWSHIFYYKLLCQKGRNRLEDDSSRGRLATTDIAFHGELLALLSIDTKVHFLLELLKFVRQFNHLESGDSGIPRKFLHFESSSVKQKKCKSSAKESKLRNKSEDNTKDHLNDENSVSTSSLEDKSHLIVTLLVQLVADVYSKSEATYITSELLLECLMYGLDSLTGEK